MQVSATRSHCAQQARVLLGQTTGRLLARLTIAAGLTAHNTGLLLVRFAHSPVPIYPDTAMFPVPLSHKKGPADVNRQGLRESD